MIPLPPPTYATWPENDIHAFFTAWRVAGLVVRRLVFKHAGGSCPSFPGTADHSVLFTSAARVLLPGLTQNSGHYPGSCCSPPLSQSSYFTAGYPRRIEETSLPGLVVSRGSAASGILSGPGLMTQVASMPNRAACQTRRVAPGSMQFRLPGWCRCAHQSKLRLR